MQQTAGFQNQRRQTIVEVNGLTNETALTFSKIRPATNKIFYLEAEPELELDKGSPEHLSLINIKQTQETDNDQKIEINDRPFLLDRFTMFCLKLILFVGQTSGAIPWKWDKRNYKLCKCSPKLEKYWKIFRNVCHFHTVGLCLYQIYIFRYFAASGNFTNKEIFIASFNLTCYLYWVDFSVNRIFHEDQMREYVNTLFKFNYEMVNKYVIDLGNYNYSYRLLNNFSILGTLNNILWCIITFLHIPYAPWFLTSYIYPKPWYWLIPGVIQTYCLYGQMIFSFLFGIWVITAHTSSVQFWLSEIHKNNPSEYTSGKIRKQKTSFEVYKSLQVLNSCFNYCISPMFFPILKIHVLVMDVMCGYIIIRSMNSLFDQDLSQFVMYPIAFMVCSVQAFTTLKMSATMHDLANSFIKSWSSTSDKKFRKTLLSCAALNVRIRRFYFIKTSTTVKFCQVVFETITNTIISFA